ENFGRRYGFRTAFELDQQVIAGAMGEDVEALDAARVTRDFGRPGGLDRQRVAVEELGQLAPGYRLPQRSGTVRRGTDHAVGTDRQQQAVRLDRPGDTDRLALAGSEVELGLRHGPAPLRRSGIRTRQRPRGRRRSSRHAPADRFPLARTRRTGPA